MTRQGFIAVFVLILSVSLYADPVALVSTARERQDFIALALDEIEKKI